MARLFLVLILISWKTGASLFSQSLRAAIAIAKLLSTVIWKLLYLKFWDYLNRVLEKVLLSPPPSFFFALAPIFARPKHRNLPRKRLLRRLMHAKNVVEQFTYLAYGFPSVTLFPQELLMQITYVFPHPFFTLGQYPSSFRIRSSFFSNRIILPCCRGMALRFLGMPSLW